VVYDSSLSSEALRKNIPALTKSRRHTLKDVAEAAGVTYRTLRNFLDGDQDMKVITANRIADFFGMTLVGLLQWREK